MASINDNKYASLNALSESTPSGGAPSKNTLLGGDLQDAPIRGEPAVTIIETETPATPAEATPIDAPINSGLLIKNSLLEIGRITRRSGRLIKFIKKVLENTKQSLYASILAITYYAFILTINDASMVHTPNLYKEAMSTP